MTESEQANLEIAAYNAAKRIDKERNTFALKLLVGVAAICVMALLYRAWLDYDPIQTKRSSSPVAGR